LKGMSVSEIMEANMSEWQPIGTAPMDGSWILLAGGSISYGWDGDGVPDAVTGQYAECLNGRKTKGRWQFAWYDGGYYGEYENPTHWMPLPEAQ